MEKVNCNQTIKQYLQSITSSLNLEHKGEILLKMVGKTCEKFFTKPQGNDRAQILSVAAGESKLALANTTITP